ncbi:MAG TPA: HD domain-containing protein [Ruminococcus sp.]|nr:HD domain-containing protein [Ruminococcus sp.]
MNEDITSMTREQVMDILSENLLSADKPSQFFDELLRAGQLDKWFPEMLPLIGLPQNIQHHHEGDVWTHTMMVLDEAAKRRDRVKQPLGFMMSALCHDFGKAVCTTVGEDGAVHSYQHEIEGLPVIKGFLERLGADDSLITYILNMAELHMEPNIMANAGSKLKKTNRLFDSSAEPFDLIQLAVCDSLGKLPGSDDTEDFLMRRYERYMEIMSRPYITAADLAAAGISGEEILHEVQGYAHKLRLAGLSRDDQLRQSLSYARTLRKEIRRS